jgi:glutamyl-Q tRNA(Asp) synthetase
MTCVTRFAPSPTGYLHLGHAHAAVTAWRVAQTLGGRFLLRIEDIDPQRCRPACTEAIFADLAWLGLHWEAPVRQQSQHMADYAHAANRLRDLDVLYPCFCSRRDIAMANGPMGPEGPLYTGQCRTLSAADRTARLSAGLAHSWRLDVARAVALAGPLHWADALAGPQTAHPELLGDVVLVGRHSPTAYHLSVTVDDALQGITHVVRGEDLFHATHIHRLLQALLSLPAPTYHHHRLILDPETGQKLSKRDGAARLRDVPRDRLAALGLLV